MKTIGAARNRWSVSARDVARKESKTVSLRKDDDYVNSTSKFQEFCR